MALGDFLFPHAELKLVIVRSFKTDVESTAGVPFQKYTDETAIVRIHSKDLQRLSVKEGGTIFMKSSCGSVIVTGIVDDKTPEGNAVMPLGPWALALVEIPKNDSPPKLQGISVTATRSDEAVTSLERLFGS